MTSRPSASDFVARSRSLLAFCSRSTCGKSNRSLKIRFTIDYKILEYYSRTTTKFFFSYSFTNNLIRDLFYVSPANKLFNLEDQFNRALSDIKLEALSVLHTRVRLKNCALNHYLYLLYT
jgi:hypothetical protein